VNARIAPLRGVVDGFRLPFEGARLLRRERTLWGLALVPFALSLVAFSAALTLLALHAGAVWGAVTGWMPALEAGRWYAWLWIGPALAALKLLGALLFAVASALVLVVAYLVASLLAAPFHDALSRRVEKLVVGAVRDEAAPGISGFLREAAHALVQEARRLAFFAIVVGCLVLLGFAIPVAQVLTAPAVVVFTVLFLPLDYAGYALDRRHLSFAQRRRWVLAHAPLMAGFGGAAFLICSVPGVNFLAMPLLVVAGTLLALRVDPSAGPAAPAGRP